MVLEQQTIDAERKRTAQGARRPLTASLPSAASEQAAHRAVEGFALYEYELQQLRRARPILQPGGSRGGLRPLAELRTSPPSALVATLRNTLRSTASAPMSLPSHYGATLMRSGSRDRAPRKIEASPMVRKPRIAHTKPVWSSDQLFAVTGELAGSATVGRPISPYTWHLSSAEGQLPALSVVYLNRMAAKNGAWRVGLEY